MHLSKLATVHTSNASNSQCTLDCQLISATKWLCGWFLPLIMLTNQLIVDMVLKITFSKGFQVALKPPLHFTVTESLWYSRPVRCSAAGLVSCLPWQLIHAFKRQHFAVILAFLRPILLDVYFSGWGSTKGKYWMRLLLLPLLSIPEKSDRMCFPEITLPPQQQANKNKQDKQK